MQSDLSLHCPNVIRALSWWDGANILNSRCIQVVNIARRVHINQQDLRNIGIRLGTTQLVPHQAVSTAMNVQSKTAADIRQEISTTANPCNCIKCTTYKCKYFEHQVYTSRKHCPLSTYQPSRLCRTLAAGIRQGATRLAPHQATSTAMPCKARQLQTSGRRYPLQQTAAIVLNILMRWAAKPC